MTAVRDAAVHVRSAPDLSAADRRDADAAVALATAFLAAARDLEPKAVRRRARRLTRLIDDPDSMAFSLALTDQVARIGAPDRAARRLRELIADHGLPSFLGPLDRLALRAAGLAGRAAPAVVAAGVRWRLRRESTGVVLEAEEPAFSRHVERRTAAGIRLNVNVLGEAILGDDEARRRLDDVVERAERPDVDYVSVKISSVCAQLSSLSFDRSVERVSERLRVLYHRAAAAEPPTFVNLDMEEHSDLGLTIAAFRHVLDEPGLRALDAGVALQAYLPDSHAAFEEVAAWAVRRRARGGGRIKVRIVKGANLAMEKVDAELHGWPQAPYPTKADVDASYKRLLERALDPCWGDAVRIGLASHNLFDVAWGLVRATDLGTLDRLELEMLEGMAVGEAEAIRRQAHQVLLYAPVVRRGEFDAAIAYLVRRLDENTSPENFLRHQFDLRPGSPAFCEQRDRFLAAVAARHHLSVAPRRAQDRAVTTAAPPPTSTRGPVLDLREGDGDGRLHSEVAPEPAFANAPDTDWSRPANRAWLAEHVRRAPAWMPTQVPLHAAGRTVTPPALLPSPPHQPESPVEPPAQEPSDAPESSFGVGIDPNDPGRPQYHYALADRALVDAAVETAVAAQARWGTTTTGARSSLLRTVASRLEARRGEAVAVMGRDAGKTASEADVEVSEAVDMAAYYAHEARRLDDVDAHHAPVGPVVVAPPWNFPWAIPAGGVLAALAAGNTVILKPAPETVLTAWYLATCLWDAGIPRDVLQLLPCPDDDVGRALVTHPGVGAVILTGAAATADLFLSWRPDLRLHAETSGKNAIVVTGSADLDLAVRDVVRSAFGHAGQKCSAASLVIIEREVLERTRFLERLADATRTLRVGDSRDPSVDVGPLIRPPEAALERALTTLDAGESWLVVPERRDAHGHLWSPGIRLGVAPGSFLHLTECFGPVLGVMVAEDLDHAIALQNAPAYGLTGGVHTLDPQEIARWVDRVEVGNAYVNRGITGAIVQRQPFGGWKRSAVGPAVKAGGPGYVASLCDWSDERPDAAPGTASPTPASARTAPSAASYTAAWERLRAPCDPTGLLAERNELRHLPLPAVHLRIQADADPGAVERCRQAARIVGTPLTVSTEDQLPDELLAARLADAPPGLRLRVVGTPSAVLWRAAADAHVFLDARAPVRAGEIELRRWCREQAVTSTAHRHGTATTDIVPDLRPRPTGAP